MNPGERLGPYEILSRIGAGGMGEVWRARDTRLDRVVAVKVLPAEFSDDAQLRVRFEREARIISHLNHPNICSLYDVGENYLVMELLEGQSLEERLRRGPLPVAEVLKVGAQIAAALDRAHRANVVHRDLKPGNVMLTKSGAKLLDFGLARATPPEVRADNTTEHKLTGEGMIVGTLQYMAPEQFGQQADHRTDLFALGALLYEMTTGRPPFDGDSRSSLIAAILSSEPEPVSRLQPLTPPALAHVIAKCLAKDPDERWQSAHDVAEELRWIAEAGLEAGAIAPGRRSRERWAWIAAVLALAALAAWLATRPSPRAEEIVAAMPLAGNGLEYDAGPPAFSPDGKWIAYSANDGSGTQAWLYSIERGTTRAVAGSWGARHVFWSPDGRFLAWNNGYFHVKKVAVTGGAPETIASRAGNSCNWGVRGVILCRAGDKIWRVDPATGELRRVLAPEAVGADAVSSPWFLPDGDHFLFLAIGSRLQKSGRTGIWIASLDGGEKPRFLLPADTNAAYAAGSILFMRDGILRAQPFDPRRLRLEGEPRPVAPVQNYAGNAIFAASDHGLLLYQRPGPIRSSNLVVKNRKGEPLRKIGETAFHLFPRVSPDGRYVAMDRSDVHSAGDIWVLGMEDGSSTRVTFNPINESLPVWSPDSKALVYLLDRTPDKGTIMMRKDLAGAAQRLIEEPRDFLQAADWSRDGNLALLRNGRDLLVWSMSKRAWMPPAASPSYEAVFSPDGKWIAYRSDETGRPEIYVQPYPPTGARYQVTPAGGAMPRWRFPNEITFSDVDARLNAVRVETVPSFHASKPQPLFLLDAFYSDPPQYDLLPDGNVLVNEIAQGRAEPLALVVNWR